MAEVALRRIDSATMSSRGGVPAALRRRWAVALLGALSLLVVGLLPLHPSPAAALIAGVAAIASFVALPKVVRWLFSRPRFRLDKRYLEQRHRQHMAGFAQFLWILPRDVPLDRLAKPLAKPRPLSSEEAAMVDKMRETSPGMVVLHAVGPAVAGVAFLGAWSGAYMLLWSLDSSAFTGLSDRPRVGEFIYVAVTATLGGTPEGIVAATAWSQMSIAAELMLAIVLVALFVPTLTEQPAARPDPPPTEEHADVEAETRESPP